MTLQNEWEVLLLFLIPIGGGIPAGVVLARDRGLPWPEMLLLYFISDVILAIVFEPIMLLVISRSKNSPKMTFFFDRFKEAIKKTTPQFGTQAGPLALIAVAFGVDPMTGRAATKAAGHGFLSGWAIAILGDMFYFSVIMISTLWLNSILGDGTLTVLIILAAMIIVPAVIRRIRQKFGRSAHEA